MTNKPTQADYGFCPECGVRGYYRERRPNGNDKCLNGHTYPSAKAVPSRFIQKEPDTHPPVISETSGGADITQADIAQLLFSDQEFIDAICGHEEGWSEIVGEKINAAAAQAIADARAEGFKLATTPTDEMKAHFEGENEIYQSFEIDGELHVLPLNFQTVKYVLDEIRNLKEQGNE